jgi:hypothetical protein
VCVEARAVATGGCVCSHGPPGPGPPAHLQASATLKEGPGAEMARHLFLSAKDVLATVASAVIPPPGGQVVVAVLTLAHCIIKVGPPVWEVFNPSAQGKTCGGAVSVLAPAAARLAQAIPGGAREAPMGKSLMDDDDGPVGWGSRTASSG